MVYLLALDAQPSISAVKRNMMQAIAEKPGLVRHKWADQGTGSGALAIGIASVCPEVSQVRYLAETGYQHLASKATDGHLIDILYRRYGQWTIVLAPVHGQHSMYNVWHCQAAFR